MNEILQLIRSARAHEETAGRHEDKYEQQMKSAGASMYQAFSLALKAQPEFHGRQIDDKAVERIYRSTKPRPWWDATLKEAGLEVNGKADRERATRLIQWHVDPDAARRRRAQHALKEATRRKSLNSKGDRSTRGARVHREEKHAATVTAAAVEAATGGRAAATAALEGGPGEIALDDLLREVNRISSAAKKVPAQFRDEVRETLVVTAREVEKYAPR